MAKERNERSISFNGIGVCVTPEEDVTTSTSQKAATGKRTRSRSGNNRIEDQANQFAAELTMPEKMLGAAIEGIAEDYMIDIDDSVIIKKLAQEFRISETVMKIRVANLFYVL